MGPVDLLAPVSPISCGQHRALRGVQAPTRAGLAGKRLNSTVYGYTFLLATLWSVNAAGWFRSGPGSQLGERDYDGVNDVLSAQIPVSPPLTARAAWYSQARPGRRCKTQRAPPYWSSATANIAEQCLLGLSDWWPLWDQRLLAPCTRGVRCLSREPVSLQWRYEPVRPASSPR